MRKFKRIDLTEATEDYFLKVGEEAYISFSNVTQVPLRIATQDGTYYEMHIIPANTGGTGGGTSAPIYLYPNNTTYSGAFYFAQPYRSAGSFGADYTQLNAFRVGWSFICNTSWITNRTQYKNIRSVASSYGVSGTFPASGAGSTDWRDTTTEWTSLGTVVFPQSTTGEILVRRLRW